MELVPTSMTARRVVIWAENYANGTEARKEKMAA
jgi:hypothetical protein